MSADITWHGIKRLTARAVHGRNTHFVDLTMTDAKGDRATTTIYFCGEDPERQAELYAASINEVDKALHPVKSITDVLRRSEEREPV